MDQSASHLEIVAAFTDAPKRVQLVTLLRQLRRCENLLLSSRWWADPVEGRILQELSLPQKWLAPISYFLLWRERHIFNTSSESSRQFGKPDLLGKLPGMAETAESLCESLRNHGELFREIKNGSFLEFVNRYCAALEELIVPNPFHLHSLSTEQYIAQVDGQRLTSSLIHSIDTISYWIGHHAKVARVRGLFNLDQQRQSSASATRQLLQFISCDIQYYQRLNKCGVEEVFEQLPSSTTSKVKYSRDLFSSNTVNTFENAMLEIAGIAL